MVVAPDTRVGANELRFACASKSDATPDAASIAAIVRYAFFSCPPVYARPIKIEIARTIKMMSETKKTLS